MTAFTEYLFTYKEDGILCLAKNLFANATDAHARQDALDKVVEVLYSVPGDLIRDEYTKQVAALIKVPIKNIKASMKQKQELDVVVVDDTSNGLRWPSGADKDEFFRWGFFTLTDGEKTGYYFQNGNSGFQSVCNFVLTPIFHKYDQDDNTRVIKIDNGVNAPEVVEMPSSAMVSVDQFKKFLFDKGTFLFFGNQQQLHKIQLRYLQDFPKAFELKTLGWQTEGFFAWFNHTFNGKLEPYNEVGLVEHGGKHFFSPAGSTIYAGFRLEDDMYENDRYLAYAPSSITFETWCQKMKLAYDDHALSGVGFALVSLFKDLVFKVDNNCPHLYCYGASQSGKSKFAESITNLFFKELPAFNLNSGTDFAFANRLARFKNCPVFLNEFDDQVVKDEWFQAIKGAYDGEGRERGKGGSKRKTEIMRVNSALILVGQYLSTKDDNSVLSRSVMRVFHKKEKRSREQNDAYDFLKLAEKEGLSGCLTELLQHRPKLEREYYPRFNETMKAMATTIRNLGKSYNERVLRNYAALVTLYEFFNESALTLPWKSAAYRQWAVEEVLMMSAMISTNDVLTDWWTTVETLFGEGLLREGEHYNIKDKRLLRMTGEDGDYDHDLGDTKEVLYLRLKNVQQLYARFKRSMGSSCIDLTSLTSYLKNRGYYLGYINSEHFVKTRSTQDGHLEHTSIKTSAHIFDFEALGITLSRSKSLEAGPVSVPLVVDGKEDDLPF
jgi:hypothetical protein